MTSFKLSFFTICFFLFSTFSFAQKMEWKQQSEFHTVMSQTFHPAEEGNFEPVKKRSGELVTAAKNWKNSNIPSNIADPQAVKMNLKKLFKDAKALNKKIKKGTNDQELNSDLSKLHDTFHTIVGLCNAKDDHENH